MPTVLRVKGYRFFFFSLDGTEPRHVHVEKGDRYAKYWLDPVRLSRSKGFRQHELTEIRRLVEQHLTLLETKWNEHFRVEN